MDGTGHSQREEPSVDLQAVHAGTNGQGVGQEVKLADPASIPDTGSWIFPRLGGKAGYILHRSEILLDGGGTQRQRHLGWILTEYDAYGEPISMWIAGPDRELRGKRPPPKEVRTAVRTIAAAIEECETRTKIASEGGCWTFQTPEQSLRAQAIKAVAQAQQAATGSERQPIPEHQCRQLHGHRDDIVDEAAAPAATAAAAAATAPGAGARPQA